MIDTIRLSSVAVLQNKGWSEVEKITINEEGTRRKYILNDQDTRITFYGQEGLEGRVVFESSVPKFINGQNVTVPGMEEIRKGIAGLVDKVENTIGQKLDPWQLWEVSRVDYCNAWEVEGCQEYLKALSEVYVPGYKRIPYTEGNNRTQGITVRNKARKVNIYDKGLESGVPGEILRFEVQNLNRSAVRSIARSEKVGMKAGYLASEELAKRQIIGWMGKVGLAGELKSKGDWYDEILKMPSRRARAIIYFMEVYKRYGEAAKNHMSIATYKRRMSECRKRGWLNKEYDKTLKSLEVL